MLKMRHYRDADISGLMVPCEAIPQKIFMGSKHNCAVEPLASIS